MLWDWEEMECPCLENWLYFRTIMACLLLKRYLPYNSKRLFNFEIILYVINNNHNNRCSLNQWKKYKETKWNSTWTNWCSPLVQLLPMKSSYLVLLIPLRPFLFPLLTIQGNLNSIIFPYINSLFISGFVKIQKI